MFVPVVAVDIAPSDAPPAMAEALLAACSTALRRGSCRPVGGVKPDEWSAATAVIVWDEADASVRVAVKVEHSSDPTVLNRRLSFTSSDARIERWRAAGLTVASLVGEIEEQHDARSEAALQSAGATEGPTPSSKLLPPPPASNAVRQGWLGLAATLAPGATAETVRVGGKLEAGFALAAPIYVLAAFDYAFSAGDTLGFETQWMTLRAGALYSERVSSSSLALGLSAEVLAQRIEASAVAPGGTESGSQWDPGVAIGVRAGLPHASNWSFSTGLDLWRLWRGTAIVLRDEEVARSSAWGASFWLGIQWDPFGRENSTP